VEGDQPIETGNLVVAHGTLNEGGRLSENSLGRTTMLLVLQKFGIFFGFCASASIARGASLPSSALLSSGRLGILSINLGHDIADLWIGIRLDEVTE
jgi:hypothetical protein